MKIGLVFGGGGSRGAYQIGVWKALIELGIDKYVEVVSGTSIGAFNAMLFQQGSYIFAEEFWASITKEQILPIKDRELGLKGILFSLGAKNIDFIKKYMPKVVKAGVLTREGAQELISKLDFQLIKNSKVKGFATCTRIPDLKPEYFCINSHSIENIKKILLATSALPMVYDSQGIDDINYLDGGVVDNVPIQPVYGENCDVIIVVSLSNEQQIDKNNFPNTYIIEITPESLEGSDLKGILDFDINTVKKRITKGYRDTLYRLKPIMDIARLIDNDSTEKKKGGKFNNLFGLLKNNG